jgi:DNA modification methylase
MKPYYEHAGITIYHGDCRELLPQLPKVDLLLTDPPYGISFSHGGGDNSGIGRGRYATLFAHEKVVGDTSPFDPTFILSLGVPTVLWGGNHFASRLPNSQSWLVWDKRAASHHTNDFADCEIAWTNLGCVARMFRHHWDGMMKASERGQSRVHPTQKPVGLMMWCLSFAPEAKTILDPFMGSGTTLRAAKDLGRKAIGIEIEERYCEIAAKRMAQEVFSFA